jgi:hypothetical protein
VLAVTGRAHTERFIDITPEAACERLVWLAREQVEGYEPAGKYFVKTSGQARAPDLLLARSTQLWERTASLVNRF